MTPSTLSTMRLPTPTVSAVTGGMMLMLVSLQPSTAKLCSTSVDVHHGSQMHAEQIGSFLSRQQSMTNAFAALVGSEAYNEAHVSTDTLVTAWTILSQLPLLVPIPHLYASDDGEIGLTWLIEGGRFAIAVADDVVAWSGNRSGKRTLGSDFAFDGAESIKPTFEALTAFHGIQHSVSV